MDLVNIPGLRWSVPPGAHPSASDWLIRKIPVTPSHFCSGCEELTPLDCANQVKRFYTAMATHPTWLIANQWLLLSVRQLTFQATCGLAHAAPAEFCCVLTAPQLTVLTAQNYSVFSPIDLF